MGDDGEGGSMDSVKRRRYSRRNSRCCCRRRCCCCCSCYNNNTSPSLPCPPPPSLTDGIARPLRGEVELVVPPREAVRGGVRSVRSGHERRKCRRNGGGADEGVEGGKELREVRDGDARRDLLPHDAAREQQAAHLPQRGGRDGGRDDAERRDARRADAHLPQREALVGGGAGGEDGWRGGKGMKGGVTRGRRCCRCCSYRADPAPCARSFGSTAPRARRYTLRTPRGPRRS